jgi:hypothetical protein
MNSNRYLNERAIQESIRSEPARYNQAHRGLNPMARYLAELKQMDEERENRPEIAEKRYRMLRLRLPGLPARDIRLPRWALLGKPSA